MKTGKQKIYPEGIFSRAGYFIGISGIYIIVGIVTLLGYRKMLVLGEAVGAILYSVGRMKIRVLHNLKYAYGDELKYEDRLELANKIIKNIGKSWTELFFSTGPRRQIAIEQITIEGKDNLDRALARGRGVIAISAHTSNYALIAPKLIQAGYSFTMVIRDVKGKVGSAMYSRCRAHVGVPSLATMPERQYYKGALRVLKNNGILCLIADENKRHGGVFVDFFGRTASTVPGPAALALRTGAAVVPIFLMRNSATSQTIIIDKEIEWQDNGDAERNIIGITSGFTKAIENFIRRDPSQWIWTNWRWRTQPWGQSDDAKIKKGKSRQKQ